MIHLLAQAAAQKLSYYLKGRMTDEWFGCYSFVLDSSVTWEGICSTEDMLGAELSDGHPVIELTKDNVVSRTCMELAVFAFICPYAQEIFGCILPDCGREVSLRLAMLVLGDSLDADMAEIADAYSVADKILLLKDGEGELLDLQYYADSTLVSFFQGQYMPSPEFEGCLAFYPAGREMEEMILWEEDAGELARRIRKVPSAVSVIYGEKFSGRRFFAAYTAGKCGLGILMVDFCYFSDAGSQSVLRQGIQHVVRDCYLLGCALCVYNAVPKGADEREEMLRIIHAVLGRFSFSGLPVFITSEEGVSIAPHLGNVVFSYTIPKLNAAQSLKVWDYFGKSLAELPEGCYKEAAGRIILPVGKIKQAAMRFSLEDDKNDISKLSELCYELIESERYSGIKRIYPTYTWEDLKLAASEKDILMQICSHVAYRDTVLEQWGMRKYYAYGDCVSALFKGAPGTGKTMAAHVVANELHMALYQVDLSSVLDKYIGETEKRLEEIFLMAEKGNVILFLDEADALLGKRSEISSSHDKYGNNAMAYLLQRIESFHGIILMATNLSGNIDHAFIRRIRYIVNFTMPDREIRRQIWQSLFHDGLPHEEIDFEFLSSDDFAFSGASIKNIMMHAMIKAGAEGVPLNMKHLISGIKGEYQKMEITAFADKWKQYDG